MKEFIALLGKPRAVMMLVPAGDPVDSVIKDLLPHLDKGDLLYTDAGKRYFKVKGVRSHEMGERAFKPFGNGIREAYRSGREL